MKNNNTYVGVGFTLQMLNNPNNLISISKVEPTDIPDDAISIIRQMDCAKVVSVALGRNIPVNKTSNKLFPGDIYYVAQVESGKLSEVFLSNNLDESGLPIIDKLPKGIKIQFYKIIIHNDCEFNRC